MHLDIILWVAGVIVTGAFSVTGWVFGMIFGRLDKHAERHDKLEARFDDNRTLAAETFATKQEVRAGFDRVMSKLDKIDDKLDRKVDKVAQ